MKTINRILTVAFLGLIGLATVLAAVGLVLPSSSRSVRSITIDAAQATVFDLVNGFGRASEWCPWHALGPDSGYALRGPATGVGASASWTSQRGRSGSGSEQITESKPCSLVRSTLDFGPGGVAESSMELEAADGSTHVVWTLETDLGSNIVARYFGLGFDRMLGPHLEQGLLDLKRLAEAQAGTAGAAAGSDG